MLHFIVMFSLFIDYNRWHYSYALLNILRLMREFVRFFLNLFSVGLFLRSLFKPIFNVPVNDVDASYEGDMVAIFISGILMRLLGALVRIIFIIFGLACSFISIIFFSIVFLLWLILPVVYVISIYILLGLTLSIL